MKKTLMLRKLIQSSDLSFIMEAHNGLSAKIVEEAGFKGIWGSGLTISASLGLRDNNEASWTQVLDVVEYMSDATKIPILLDGDTGHGNFNNMRRLVKKLEQRDIAGVCIEDKVFPKTNSFLRGEKQPLADIDEFAGKIKAGLDARKDNDFCIIARVEALIAGWGMEEALKRAEAYRQAGADAILIHSKKSTADEIFDFMQEWGDRSPVVIVPTKYYSTPTKEFRENKISLVIWANHVLRSSILSMQKTAESIFKDESITKVEDKVASLSEVFRLQNDQELLDAENRYLKKSESQSAIILAAGLDSMNQEIPKTLVKVNGNSILENITSNLKSVGMQNIYVVRGYKKEAFPELGLNYVDNDFYNQTDELYSLKLALDQVETDCVLAYGDVLFRRYILVKLLENTNDISIIVDKDFQQKQSAYRGDFVRITETNSGPFLLENKLIEINNLEESFQGEWIGLISCSKEGVKKMKSCLNEMNKSADFNKYKLGDLLNFMVQKDIKVAVEYISGDWMDIDNHQDFIKSQGF